MGTFTVRRVLSEHRNSLPARSKGILAAWGSRLTSFQIQFVNNICTFLYRLQGRRCRFCLATATDWRVHLWNFSYDSSKPNGNTPPMPHLTFHQNQESQTYFIRIYFIKHNLNTQNYKFKTLGKALGFFSNASDYRDRSKEIHRQPLPFLQSSTKQWLQFKYRWNILGYNAISFIHVFVFWHLNLEAQCHLIQTDPVCIKLVLWVPPVVNLI